VDIIVTETNAKYVLLGLLSHTPMTGYDIKKAVATHMSYFWDLSYGQIYPTLQQLEKTEYITKQIQINQNRPNRKIYTITPKGTTALQAWLVKPAKKETHKYEFLLKLIFADQATPQQSIKHIEEFKERNQKILQTMLQFEKDITPLVNKNESYFYVLLTLLLGKNISEASVQWADTALDLMRQHSSLEVKR
jgi:DNA-binding PadR family transcriptional regulator